MQLYAAAAAAAAGEASSIWVGRANRTPHLPLAGIAFDDATTLQAVPVMGQDIAVLPWQGPVKPEPAFCHAAGEHIAYNCPHFSALSLLLTGQ